MLDREKPDVLPICTPHYLHTPMAVGAMGYKRKLKFDEEEKDGSCL